MEKAKRISWGSVDTMYALSSFFINNFTHLHLQLEWLISIPWSNSIIIILYPPPLFATKHSWCRSSWFWQNQEAVNWTSSSPPERTQCRQGSMRGGCSTNWNCCLIDAGVHLPVMCPSIWWFLRYLLPSKNSLIIIQGSLLHASQGPRVTVRVFRKDDEINGSRGSAGS